MLLTSPANDRLDHGGRLSTTRTTSAAIKSEVRRLDIKTACSKDDEMV
jgi:hypothetical protein